VLTGGCNAAAAASSTETATTIPTPRCYVATTARPEGSLLHQMPSQHLPLLPPNLRRLGGSTTPIQPYNNPTNRANATLLASQHTTLKQ
jgi:hypothetical protein